MDLRKLTDDQLHSSALTAAKRERQETLNVLSHLSEIERRRMFSKYKFDSLHAYCVGYLKLSEGQAGRHVAASRLLNELPSLQEKVSNGSINFTHVCQVSSFINREASIGNELNENQKLELVAKIENESTRKADQILLSHSLRPEVHFRESVKQKTETHTQVTLVLDEETMEHFNRLREIWAHALPGATLAQILKRSLAETREKHDPILKAKRATVGRNSSAAPRDNSLLGEDQPCRAHDATPAPERFVPSAVRHAVWVRDKGQCTFADPRTGEVCESKYMIELDHITAFAHEGENTAANLRLRCRAHNHRHAVDTFGSSFIQRFVN